MKEEKKELVWLPESLAKELACVSQDAQRDFLISSYIKESKAEIKSNLEGLADDVIRYKAMMIEAKQAFEAAKNEQLTASYELWEKFEAEMPNVKAKISMITETLSPIKKELQEIIDLYRQIEKWRIDELLKTIQEIHSIISGDDTKAQMIKFLFSNFKKEEKS